MQSYTLLSIQVGKPQVYREDAGQDEKESTWMSGIYKAPVQGPIWVGKLNLDGDGQADLRYHGGVDRPILGYSADYYPQWQSELGIPLEHGAFGENFTMAGLCEDTVCIGDVYRLGPVLVQVSQPRKPCWKLSRRHGIPGLAASAEKTGRTGWYMRVLQEGFVEAGMELVLQERPYPEWTVTKAHEVARERKKNPEAARALGQCPYLSADWKEMMLLEAGQ
jgi:MOSC domain-containing protein YiiM